MDTTKNRYFRYVTGAALIAMAMQCGSARSAVVYDNLGSAPYYTFGYATFGLYSDGVRYERGMQFTSSQTVTLSTLELALGEAYFPSGNPVQSGTAKIELKTDSANTPGSVLETWTSETISGSPTTGGVLNFPSVLAPTLTAGTKYWIVLSDPSGSNLGGAWYFADDAHAGNTLTLWHNLSTDNTVYATLTRGYRTRVTGNLPSIIPTLAIARSGNDIEISWTTNAPGGMLQGGSSISAPMTWTNIGPGTIFGDRYIVTEPIGSGAKFFRWVK